MRNLAIMIKPASSLCNLKCKYCFYEDLSDHRLVKSHGLMGLETMRKILGNIFICMDSGDRITFAFQGGEPTLAGLSYFKEFVSAVKELNCGCEIEYQLQTNGILLDQEWCEFLKQENFLVGLSIDGFRENHDKNRVDQSGNGTFEQVMAAKRMLDQYQIAYNVLMTLTSDMAKSAEEVWEFIKREQFEYVQFTPCMAPLGDAPVSGTPEALRPELFAKFYTKLFSLWSVEWKKGNRMVIKLFDDLITLLAVGAVTACGLTGKCTPQIIVESNGDVYPCDFFTLDEYRAGNLCHDTIKTVYESPKQVDFLRISHENMHLCGNCRFLRICGGNCKRMQKHVCYGAGDVTCGYRIFLENTIHDFAEIARREFRF